MIYIYIYIYIQYTEMLISALQLMVARMKLLLLFITTAHCPAHQCAAGPFGISAAARKGTILV
jgi:hypothetical protein